MREIKFRAWNKNEQKMTTPFAWVNESNLISSSMGSTPTHQLMQYTGLKDKNGVEIYEGDLVVDRDREQPAIVEYREDNCCFMLSSNSFVTKECVNRFQYEVIGNTHENPELLE